ncbi:MAG: diaminopimelate decarboxylase [Candidatus Gracilibacteria bacterium]|nr:diaminopimelate decarboxylase [Candidatus Gracilibacteria bacterium]
MHQLNFLSKPLIEKVSEDFQTPVYVYSEAKLNEAADNFLAFPSAFGHSVRYAMKANANNNILALFQKKGILIDCSSEYEAYRALSAGYEADKLQISGQETPTNLVDLLEKGVKMVATSLSQIKAIGQAYKNSSCNSDYEIGVRINPGTGSGAFKAISTGGETSSFGIWHESIPQIKELSAEYNLIISKIHIHIGSENTPESWTDSANIGLDFVSQFPEVTTLDLGGGFKKAIMPYEKSADLQEIGKSVQTTFEKFAESTGRKIHLEVEPGKYMVINSCSVISKIDDIVHTGNNGYNFIRTNTGMTEMPRVPMYGVQQPIVLVKKSGENIQNTQNYVVVGHCCESGDILTTKLYEQEEIETITLNNPEVGDYLIIEGTGAYNASMSMKNYNSFPEAGELLLRESGEIVEIRKRQQLSDIWQNEISVI